MFHLSILTPIRVPAFINSCTLLRTAWPAHGIQQSYSTISLYWKLEERKHSSTDSEHICNHRVARRSERILFTTVFCANDRIKSSKHKKKTACKSPVIRYFTCTYSKLSWMGKAHLIIIQKHYVTFKNKAL